MKGLVHIYTGDGKGKTTAAIGLGVRACGSGLKVLMVQFLKSSQTGEMNMISKMEPLFTLYRSKEVKGFFWDMDDEQKKRLREIENDTFNYAKKESLSDNLNILILDEIMGSIKNNLVSIQDVINLIINKPESLEIILTGRNAPKELIELADYVSEINAIKHPIANGIAARRGIEY